MHSTRRARAIQRPISAQLPAHINGTSALKPEHGITVDPPQHRRSLLRLKRVVDLCVAACGVILVLPIGVAIAVAIKLTSRGPVFFIQRRPGAQGTTFSLIKFRTMQLRTDEQLKSDADAWSEYVRNDFKLSAADPRITAVGRFLRRSSLDELPQLLNILRGDMSLVGIRPLITEQLAMRSAYDRACYRSMRPGLTGLWQVEGRSRLSHEDRIALDREYVETWRPRADVKILLRTPFAICRTSRSR